jgi:hypothetical protein
VIIVEAKLSVLLEVSRTRSGATQILQSPFFEVFRGFSLTPDMLVHVQRNLISISLTKIIRIKRIPSCCHTSSTVRYTLTDFVWSGDQSRTSESGGHETDSL